VNKQLLESYINSGLSLRKIVEKTGKSLTTIRYWARKYNLKSNFKRFKDAGKKEYGEFRFCPGCEKEVLTKDFYKKRGVKYSSSYCKVCTNQITIKKQRLTKLKMIEYKGGSCEVCGYNKSPAAMDFHHKDPSKKEFTIAHARHRSFNDKMKMELDKCLLVCSNCHREIHEEMASKRYKI
jgi:transposase